ncbi:hypothetical protein B4144_4117 [Bacillus atrophaeus]|nr:hypothetical protein B4144_4117 [Bacillus atrophaeus]
MQKKIALKNKVEMPFFKKGGLKQKRENQCDFLSHLITSHPPQ